MPQMSAFTRLAEDFTAHWLNTASVAVALVVFTFVLHWLGVRLIARLVRGHAVAHGIAIAVRRPTLFVLPLVLLQLFWQLADDDLRGIDGVRHVNGLLLIASTSWLALRLVRGIAQGLVEMNPANVDDDFRARRINTQTRVLARSMNTVIVIVGIALMIMTFPGASRIGASLLASAGVAGLIAGLAARPAISNMIAGLQIAIAQPIRLDDVLIIQGEWGRVEEITGTYVVLRIWDERRLVIPLTWFIENPFQNWTRQSARLTGTVFIWVDYAMPLEPLREEALRICEGASEWDGRQCLLQVFEAGERGMQLRLLVSAPNADRTWDLRCKVREGLIVFMQREYPQHLPRGRAEMVGDSSGPAPGAAAESLFG